MTRSLLPREILWHNISKTRRAISLKFCMRNCAFMDIMTHAEFHFNRLMLTLISGIWASEPPPPWAWWTTENAGQGHVHMQDMPKSKPLQRRVRESKLEEGTLGWWLHHNEIVWFNLPIFCLSFLLSCNTSGPTIARSAASSSFSVWAWIKVMACVLKT